MIRVYDPESFTVSRIQSWKWGSESKGCDGMAVDQLVSALATTTQPAISIRAVSMRTPPDAPSGSRGRIGAGSSAGLISEVPEPFFVRPPDQSTERGLAHVKQLRNLCLGFLARVNHPNGFRLLRLG
jgi:hypothetical protein